MNAARTVYAAQAVLEAHAALVDSRDYFFVTLTGSFF